MKIIAICGSYRKKGNTTQIIELIEQQMKAAAAEQGEPLEFESIDLGHQNIALCRGCRVCFNKGEEHCPLKDDLQTIKAKMQTADGILLATPVYVNDVSGILKNWIDRLAHVCHRPEFAGKCAYLIATVGVGPTSHALKTMKFALSSWGYYIAGQASFKMGALMKQNTSEALFSEDAGKIARKLIQVIQQRSFSNPSFISLMTFKIQQADHQQSDPNSLDHRYWQNLGWTNPKTVFYTFQRASPLKVMLARSFGAFFARFVM